MAGPESATMNENSTKSVRRVMLMLESLAERNVICDLGVCFGFAVELKSFQSDDKNSGPRVNIQLSPSALFATAATVNSISTHVSAHIVGVLYKIFLFIDLEEVFERGRNVWLNRLNL